VLSQSDQVATNFRVRLLRADVRPAARGRSKRLRSWSNRWAASNFTDIFVRLRPVCAGGQQVAFQAPGARCQGTAWKRNGNLREFIFVNNCLTPITPRQGVDEDRGDVEANTTTPPVTQIFAVALKRSNSASGKPSSRPATSCKPAGCEVLGGRTVLSPASISKSMISTHST